MAINVALAPRILTREPVTPIRPEVPMGETKIDKAKAYLQIVQERLLAARAPGKGLGLNTIASEKSTNKITDKRDRNPDEIRIPVSGIYKDSQGRYQVEDIANPDSPDGAWDPRRYAPNFHFDDREDSYPVRPGFDGDQLGSTDPRNYLHGQVGGAQPLEMSFSVSKKGEYYVLQYSSYYVDNKMASEYHDGDWSTVSVYLKPGKDGKLAPAYMYTSWHWGGIMTPWEDLQKDAGGNPSVMIGRGSHAVTPVGRGMKVPDDRGLVVKADGTMAKRGSAASIPNTLHYNSPQGNILGAERLGTGTGQERYAMDVYYGARDEQRNPYHPILFKNPKSSSEKYAGLFGGRS
ncbi:hypothetical protein J7643_02745 [bacterium]|nr:hypothetical protein [bacterium]